MTLIPPPPPASRKGKRYVRTLSGKLQAVSAAYHKPKFTRSSSEMKEVHTSGPTDGTVPPKKVEP